MDGLIFSAPSEGLLAMSQHGEEVEGEMCVRREDRECWVALVHKILLLQGGH